MSGVDKMGPYWDCLDGIDKRINVRKLKESKPKLIDQLASIKVKKDVDRYSSNS